MPNNIIHFILSILMSLLHILRIPQPWLQAQGVFICLYLKTYMHIRIK
jgi:hypothetical protein